jgi:hypothetical protein
VQPEQVAVAVKVMGESGTSGTGEEVQLASMFAVIVVRVL